MRAWTLFTAPDTGSYAGHDGYADVLARQYAYDDQVPNHKAVDVGDVIVLRNGTGSLGVGFVEGVESERSTKTRRRCPVCSTSQIERRTKSLPRYRCTNGHTTDDPVVTEEPVIAYVARYERSFAASTALSAAALERLCLAHAKQNAIREVDLDGLLTALREAGVWPTFSPPGR